MKQALLLSFLYLLTCTALIAQKSEVTLKVIDGTNEQPIEFATIFITPCECGGATDEKGTLQMNLEEGAYQITSSNLGYTTDTTFATIPATNAIEIKLYPQGYDLETITVVGEDNRLNIERTELGIQQLNANQIRALPTAIGEIDILRSLTMLSGVGSAGEASNGVSVRGGSLDQNLILLDGAPIFNPTHLFGVFSVFTPDAVSAVELYKANLPAKFGGRITSVMDVRVKNPNTEKFKLSGGIGLVSSRIAVETPIVKKKLSLLASARVSNSDLLFTTIERLKNTKAQFQDATIKLSWKASDRDNIFWTGFYSHDFYQLDINSNINSIIASSNQFDYTSLNNTINWLRTFKNNATLQTNFVTSNYDPSILFPQAESDNVIRYDSRIRYRSVFSEYSQSLGNTLDISAGVQGIQNILSPGQLIPGTEDGLEEVVLPDENGFELSGFANFDWTPNDRLAVSGGLRYTQFLLVGAAEEATYASNARREIVDITSFGQGEIVATYGGLEPRLGIRLKTSESASVKLGYAYTRQYLQNIYNSTTPLPTSRWKMSDRYIQPQTGNTYSAGFYKNLKNNTITFSAEGYYSTIENVVDYKAGADFFLQPFIEQDIVQAQGRSYGLEFNFAKPQGVWNGWFNYTWARSLRRTDEVDFRSQINANDWFPSDFDRPHVFNGTINFEANEFNTFSFNLVYQTGRPYTVANAVFEINEFNVPIFLERNNSRLPDYHRLDFSWRIHNISTKTEKRWKGDWIFTIYNLYGRKNAYNIYYQNRQDGDFGSIFGASPLGAYQLSIFRSALVSLSYSFVFE